MISDAELLALEKHFWTGDAPFYDQHLSADATMVFPAPAGVLRRDQIVASIAQSPRWREVRINDPFITRPSASFAVLTYQAEAIRGDQPPYSAQVTSVYTLDANGWRLAFHQQSAPVGAMGRKSAARSVARIARSAIGAAAMGALATGAFAIGALAVGRLAIGALKIGRARVRSLTIDELTVRRVRFGPAESGR